jgi:hypothetical protein
MVVGHQQAALEGDDGAWGNMCVLIAPRSLGGVYLVPRRDGSIQLYLWHSHFPLKVMMQLVTAANPVKKVNNSDLELAGSVAQHGIMYQMVYLQDFTIHNFFVNTATLVW